ncbi:hypothetical protein FQR65_LT20352 [Abscondita terminalis]|nr:hypothetical protein FQR65_LT20352 [Abscondita terminalis]
MKVNTIQALALAIGPAPSACWPGRPMPSAAVYPHKPVTIVVAYFRPELSGPPGHVRARSENNARAPAAPSAAASCPRRRPTATRCCWHPIPSPWPQRIAQAVVRGHGYDVLNGFTPVIEVGSTSLFPRRRPLVPVPVRSRRVVATGAPARHAHAATAPPMHFLAKRFQARHRRAPGACALQGRGACGSPTVVGGHVAFNLQHPGLHRAPNLPAAKLVALALADGPAFPAAPPMCRRWPELGVPAGAQLPPGRPVSRPRAMAPPMGQAAQCAHEWTSFAMPERGSAHGHAGNRALVRWSATAPRGKTNAADSSAFGPACVKRAGYPGGIVERYRPVPPCLGHRSKNPVERR